MTCLEIKVHCFSVESKVDYFYLTSVLLLITPIGNRFTDFAFGTKFAPKDDAGMQKKKVAELLNGRLAMIAVGGIATQSIITGHGFPYI